MADEAKAAVYVAWSTFKNALDGLAQGIPNRVDRSAFPGLAGGVQSQLLAGMKFLGLITDDHHPTKALHLVAVPDEAARKEKLAQILRDRYSELFALDLMKVTPAQLAEQMGASYSVSGATREKAIRFFLSAVEYVGIPVSRLFKSKSGNGTASARRRRPVRPRGPVSAGDPTPGAEPGPVQPGGGTTRVVKLKSGGTLTVLASLDLFSLSPTDRTFVFELIDRLEKYERTSQEEG
jgi:hypothetical protein